MTVIYSNFGDIDTSFAPLLWSNIPNVNMIEITPDMIDTYEDIVNNAISIEDDTLIMYGHGTSYGLLFPDLNSGTYLVHDENVHLIHARQVICIWCYASGFAARHPELHGFFSSMFISNINEAHTNNIGNTSENQINQSNELFLRRAHDLLINNVPLNEWVINLGARMDIDNEVEVFNYQGLYYQ